VPNLLTYLTSLLRKRPTPTPVADLPAPTQISTPQNMAEKEHMPPLNSSTVAKYNGAVEHLLVSCRCMELSEVTPVHLDRYLARQNSTSFQRSRLLTLWTGSHDPSPELVTLLEAICSKK
jgi:hypothetical protein